MRKRHEVCVEDFTGAYSIQSQMAGSAGDGHSKTLWIEIKLSRNGVRLHEFTVKQDGKTVLQTGMFDFAVERYNELP